jgi:hypothetical protein
MISPQLPAVRRNAATCSSNPVESKHRVFIALKISGSSILCLQEYNLFITSLIQSQLKLNNYDSPKSLCIFTQ